MRPPFASAKVPPFGVSLTDRARQGRRARVETELGAAHALPAFLASAPFAVDVSA
jgi:hypothetical protein